jgi:hypothetical protein
VTSIAVHLAAVEYTEEKDKLKAVDKSLKVARSKRTALKEKLKAMRKARGHSETSIHSRLDDLLKLSGISKEPYHGGQLAGNGCRDLVSRIGEIGPEMFQDNEM